MTGDPSVAHRRLLFTGAYEMLGSAADAEDVVAPGGRIEVAGEPAAVSVVVADGRVARVYLVRNPRKLTRLDEPADLAR